METTAMTLFCSNHCTNLVTYPMKNLFLVDKKRALNPLWKACTHDYSFLLSLLIALKIWFANFPVCAKRSDECAFLGKLSPTLIDLHNLVCPKASEFNHHFSVLPQPSLTLQVGTLLVKNLTYSTSTSSVGIKTLTMNAIAAGTNRKPSTNPVTERESQF